MPSQQEIVAVIAAAREAGRLIEDVRRSAHLDVASKGDQGPVTRADRASDDYLRRELPNIVPAAWLSEETADDHARLTTDRVWVVDPLDGTKEFVEGVPQYSVAIALVENGLPVLGVVHCPPTGDVYAAVWGGGATKNGAPVHAKAGPLMLVSRSEVKRGEFDEFTGWEMQPIGSIALKLAMIAAGEAAVTLSRGPKWEWDVCAGALLVSEAGGRVSDVLGDALHFNQEYPKVKGVLAGEGAAYARALDRVKQVGVSDRMTEGWR